MLFLVGSFGGDKWENGVLEGEPNFHLLSLLEVLARSREEDRRGKRDLWLSVSHSLHVCHWQPCPESSEFIHLAWHAAGRCT